MNILFRADSASTIGTGHIMRDLVLAKQFLLSNVTFATLDLKGNINEAIINAGYNLEILVSNDANELVRLVEKLKIDLLIIDHYQINYEMERYIKKKSGVSLLVLDDLYKRHYCDILINHNISADSKKYVGLVPELCELRCGGNYTLLRDEFYEVNEKKYKKHTKYKTIFISIGGTDHTQINILILKALESFDNIRVILVTTKANDNLRRLQKYIQNKKWITLHINANNIAILMKKSDLAIISSSSIVHEILHLKTPFIAIKTAKNQQRMYDYLRRNHYSIIDRFNEYKLKQQIKKYI